MGIISKFVRLFVLLLGIIHTVVTQCNLEVYSAYFQRQLNDIYYLHKNYTCDGKPVYMTNGYSGYTYYIYFVDESPSSTGFRGWVIGSSKCSTNSGVVFAHNDDPYAPYPPDVTHDWEEAIGGSQYRRNSWMGTRCEGSLSSYSIFFIVLGSVIGLGVLVGVIYYCIKKKRQPQTERQTGQTNIPMTEIEDYDNGGFMASGDPPPDLIMDAPPYMELPPSYEDIFGDTTVPVVPAGNQPRVEGGDGLAFDPTKPQEGSSNQPQVETFGINRQTEPKDSDRVADIQRSEPGTTNIPTQGMGSDQSADSQQSEAVPSTYETDAADVSTQRLEYNIPDNCAASQNGEAQPSGSSQAPSTSPDNSLHANMVNRNGATAIEITGLVEEETANITAQETSEASQTGHNSGTVTNNQNASGATSVHKNTENLPEISNEAAGETVTNNKTANVINKGTAGGHTNAAFEAEETPDNNGPSITISTSL